MRRRWRGRVEAIESEATVLAGDDGARLRLPAEWLPGADPGDSVELALRLRRHRHARRIEEGEITRHAPWLDTLSLVALAVGVAALVYHLFLR